MASFSNVQSLMRQASASASAEAPLQISKQSVSTMMKVLETLSEHMSDVAVAIARDHTTTEQGESSSSKIEITERDLWLAVKYLGLDSCCNLENEANCQHIFNDDENLDQKHLSTSELLQKHFAAGADKESTYLATSDPATKSGT